MDPRKSAKVTSKDLNDAFKDGAGIPQEKQPEGPVFQMRVQHKGRQYHYTLVTLDAVVERIRQIFEADRNSDSLEVAIRPYAGEDEDWGNLSGGSIQQELPQEAAHGNEG